MNLPMFDLRGRVALIAGGNSGIGLGMAEGLAQAGAAVCISILGFMRAYSSTLTPRQNAMWSLMCIASGLGSG